MNKLLYLLSIVSRTIDNVVKLIFFSPPSKHDITHVTYAIHDVQFIYLLLFMFHIERAKLESYSERERQMGMENR